MNVLPVIVRELRAESRHTLNYWLRVYGAGAALLAASAFVLQHGFNAEMGAELFQWLHAALLCALWVLVPILAADCLSQERREGTLGLLFLTPLKPIDIVVAKSLTHGLRSLTLLLAVLPVATLPMLMGGVTWKQCLASLCINVASLTLALASGLLASALSKSWVRSLVLAFCIAAICAWFFCLALGCLMSPFRGATFIPNYWNDGWFRPGIQIALKLDPDYYNNYYYGGMLSSIAGAQQHTLMAASIALLASISLLALVMAMTATITRQLWQERPPHPAIVWLKARFCSPVLMLGLLQHWMKRNLEHNPIGWLERRTWSGRLVIWSWLAVMVSIYSFALTNPNFLTRSMNQVHTTMASVLLLSIAVNASGSFRRERETRVLELLLVSPLTEGQIILGRLRGLWGQFLPTLVVLLGGWLYLATALDRLGREFSSILVTASAFVSVPVIGLYFSLGCRNMLGALTWTVLVAIFSPRVLALIAKFLLTFFWQTLSGPASPGPDSIATDRILSALVQLLIAGFVWVQLHRQLRQRRFATASM